MRPLTTEQRAEYIQFILNAMSLLTDDELRQLTAAVVLTDTCRTVPYDKIMKGGAQ